VVAMVCVISLVIVGCGPTGTPTEQEAKTVKIGLGVPLTGAAATSGGAMTEGTMIHFKYVNDELGGIEYRDPVSGETEKVRLDVLVGDSQYNAARTVAVYKQQQGAGVIAMIIAGSTTIEAVANMAIRDKIAIIAQGGGMSSGLFKTEPKYWTMCQVQTASHTVPAMQLIRDIWGEARNPRLAIMLADTPAARAAFSDPVLEELLPAYGEQIGVDLVAYEWHPFALTDSSVELTRIMAEEPDWIYMSNGALNTTVVVVKDAVRLGISDKVKIMSWWGGADDGILEVAPEEAEGMYGQVWVSLPNEDLPGINLAHRLTQKYYGHDATTNNLVGLVSSMAMVEAVKTVMEEVGYDNLTGDSLNNALHSIKDFDSGGIWPAITIDDPNYPVLVKSHKHFVVEGGEFKPVRDWYSTPSFLVELEERGY